MGEKQTDLPGLSVSDCVRAGLMPGLESGLMHFFARYIDPDEEWDDLGTFSLFSYQDFTEARRTVPSND